MATESGAVNKERRREPESAKRLDREASVGEFARVAARLGELMAEEAAALREGNHESISSFNYRKGHGLLEFSRAISALPPGAASDPRIMQHASELRSKIEQNMRTLNVHMSAVQEVTSVLASAIRESESDGTYTPSIWRAGS